MFLFALVAFGNCSYAMQPDLIDESALEDKVLTLEEVAKGHATAITQLNENVVSLNERVSALEAYKEPAPLVALRAPSDFDVPDIAPVKPVPQPVALTAANDGFEYEQDYREQPQDEPQNESYGSNGSSAIVTTPTVQYGSVVPMAASGGSAGSFAAAAPVYAAPVYAAPASVVRSRFVARTARPGIFGRIAANRAAANAAFFQPANTSSEPVFCVDANGQQVACN